MNFKNLDIINYNIILTNNYLESLIEKYSQKEEYMVISNKIPTYYLFSVIKEKIDQGFSINFIIQQDIYKKNEFFRSFDKKNCKKSEINVPFHEKKREVAKRIIDKAFELFLEKEYNYKIQFASFILSYNEIAITNEIIERGLINQNFINRFTRRLLKKYKELGIENIPEFLSSTKPLAKREDIKEERKELKNFTSIYRDLLSLKELKDEKFEIVRKKLETDCIQDLIEHYLNWTLEKSEERSILVSDLLQNLYGFLFKKENKLHPLIKNFATKEQPNNVVLLIFDHLGYFDFLYSISKSKLWETLSEKHEVGIIPAFSSFITTTEHALSYLTRQDQGKKSLVEKIVDQMIEENDPITIITASQWKQNNPYNKKLFASKRSGFIKIPTNIFTLNSLKPYITNLEGSHYLVIYSSEAISHTNASINTLSEHIEQSVIKRVLEATNLFPNSTIIAIGDHGIQWKHRKIEIGTKLDGNKRISTIPVENYAIEEIEVDKYEILKLLNLKTPMMYPLKPSLMLELPNTKISHGGFSFSELVVPLVIIRPKKIKPLLVTKEKALKTISKELKDKEEEYIPLENVRDIILHYLGKNGPSFVSDITQYVSKIKNKEYTEGYINQYMASLLKYGNVVKGNPSEGSSKRAKVIIWYLPKQKSQYDRFLSETEEKLLSFIREKRACLFKPISKGLNLKRGFTLSMLYRLIHHKKIELKEFERQLFIYNNLIYSKVYIYYIPGQEEYAIKRISEIKSSLYIQRSQDRLIKNFDSLVDQLNIKFNFEIPEIIKSEALKITLEIFEKPEIGRGLNNVDLSGASLLISFRKFRIPIPINVISEAVVYTNLILKNKKLEEIDNIKNLFSIKKRNIRKLRNKIKKKLDLKITTFSYEDYFNFIVLNLDCSYYIRYFGNFILKELENINVSSIDSRAIAGAIVYYIIRKIRPLGICYNYYNQKSIAQSINITEVTLRKGVKFLEQVMKISFSDKFNELEDNVSRSVSFKKVRILDQKGEVITASYPKGVELLIKENIINTLDLPLIYDDIPPIKNLKMQRSLLFFLENKIIEGILDEKYFMIISSNDFIKYIMSGRSRVFICQNSIDKNLRLSFTPRVVLLNLPLSFVKKYINLAGIELAEFYVQTINTGFIHLILIDADSIEDHSIPLFDILEDLKLEEHQKSITVPDIEGLSLYDYVLKFEESIEEEDFEDGIEKKTKMDKFLEWVKEEEISKKVVDPISKQTQKEEHPLLNELLENFKSFIENPKYIEIMKNPKDCSNIINQSLEAYYVNLLQPSFETIFTALEKLLLNYHSKFIRSTERLDMHGYLAEFWQHRLITKELRDQINVLSRCRNDVKHGREDVDVHYFNTYFPLVLDSIKKLCYEYYMIPAVLIVIKKLSELKDIQDHNNLIPLQNDPNILKSWLFKKPGYLNIYEREESKDLINKFNFILEFFTDFLKDKKRKKFYFKLEVNVERIDDEYKIEEIIKLD